MKYTTKILLLCSILFIIGCNDDDAIQEELIDTSILSDIDNPIALDFIRRNIAQTPVPPYPLSNTRGSTGDHANRNSSNEDQWQTFEEEYGAIHMQSATVIDSLNVNTVFPLLDNSNKIIGLLTGFYNDNDVIEFWVKPIESKIVIEEGYRIYYIVSQEAEGTNKDETQVNRSTCTTTFKEVCEIYAVISDECVTIDCLEELDLNPDLKCRLIIDTVVCVDGEPEVVGEENDNPGSGGGGADGFVPVNDCPEGQIKDPFGLCICELGRVEDSNGNCIIPEPTPCETALLSNEVYNTVDGQIETGNDPIPLELSGGWELNNTLDVNGITLTDEESGFNSALYQKIVNGQYQYLYVTEGTTGLLAVNDWLNNVTQVLGSSTQYQKSVASAIELHNRVGNNQLFFAGHSLGGGLASANALATGRSAYTYNAAGLSDATKNLYDNGHNPYISATIVKGEILDFFQKKINKRAEGIITEIEKESSEWVEFFSDRTGLGAYEAYKKHLIETVIDILNCLE